MCFYGRCHDFPGYSVMKTKTPPTQPPPVFEQGYAVFVKLWDITAAVSADVAVHLFNTLDKLLLSSIRGTKEKWFPSPYGGAIVVADVESALKAARDIIQRTEKEAITASVGIAFGGFDRVLTVTRWNTAALAMNIAARMASNAETKGRVAVQPKVHTDAVSAKKEFEALFEPKATGRVKATTFEYYLIKDAAYRQQIKGSITIASTKKPSRPSDIVLFDIERYSEQPQEVQMKLVDGLSKCVEFAISGGSEPDYFGPAGDGGYVAFINKPGRTGPTAWSFAKGLKSQAERENIPIRIGIANGPVLSSSERTVVGGVVLLADAASSHARTGGIAVTQEFWDTLANQLKHDWEISSIAADSFLLLQNKSSTPGPIAIATQDNQIPEVSKFEIDMYWGYRPAAHQDLREAVLNCRSQLFIAGLGVTTIATVLNDPSVVTKLAYNIAQFATFERTIVTFTRGTDPRVNEEGGRELGDKIKSGRRELRRFYKALDERVPKHIVRPLIDFRSYDETTIPRHFILQADEVIYVGSYLSHQQGAYSYLLKIRNRSDGLYELFANEIDYIKRHTLPQSIDDDP